MTSAPASLKASTWGAASGAIQRSILAASVCTAAIGFAGSACANAFWPIETPTTTASFQGGMVLGSMLLTYSDITFNSLGFIDVNNDALSVDYHYFQRADTLLGSYQVGIWLVSTQELLASAIVTPDSPLGPDNSGFRYASIAPTTIRAGQQFIVGALLPANPSDAWLADILNANMEGIVGLAIGRYVTGSTLSFPSLAFGSTIAVANASTHIVPVPEPATAGYVVAGLACVALYSRQRRSGSRQRS